MTPSSASLEVVPVPAGRFRMGSETGRPDERPVHLVEVSAFSLGRTPVTRAQFEPFVLAGHAEPPPWWSDAAFSLPDQPVVGVTWFEAEAFARWLGEMTGAIWRLPSEAEWEWAARSGGDPLTPWGDGVPEGEVPEGPLGAPWPAGRGQPNGFGLLDMGTLVHEWCADWYAADYYATSPGRDPRGPAEGQRRASRGGSWRHHVRWSPPASRSSLPPAFRYSDYSFRLLRERSAGGQ